eukprot:gene1263-721_t
MFSCYTGIYVSVNAWLFFCRFAVGAMCEELLTALLHLVTKTALPLKQALSRDDMCRNSTDIKSSLWQVTISSVFGLPVEKNPNLPLEAFKSRSMMIKFLPAMNFILARHAFYDFFCARNLRGCLRPCPGPGRHEVAPLTGRMRDCSEMTDSPDCRRRGLALHEAQTESDNAAKATWKLTQLLKQQLKPENFKFLERHPAVGDSLLDSQVLESIKEFVQHGANIIHYDSMLQLPLLHALVEYGETEAVGLMLQTPHPVDFTVTGGLLKATPLHLLCIGSLDDSTTLRILDAIINRLQSSELQGLGDKIDWDQEMMPSHNMLQCAAQNQKLSLIWPALVQRVPFFMDRANKEEQHPRCSFDGRVIWSWDMEALPLGHQNNCFDMSGAQLVQANEATGKLCRIHAKRPPIPQNVFECVRHGADVLFRMPHGCDHSLLHFFVEIGEAECVRACLTTHHHLDLTVRNANGRTPLHCIFTELFLPMHETVNTNVAAELQSKKRCIRKKSSQMVRDLLSLFLERLEMYEGKDEVDWSLLDADGRDILALAAERQELSVVWPLLKAKRIPYYMKRDLAYPENHRADSAQHEESLRLLVNAKVCKADWESLSRCDRRRLKLQEPNMFASPRSALDYVDPEEQELLQKIRPLHVHITTLMDAIRGPGMTIADGLRPLPLRVLIETLKKSFSSDVHEERVICAVPFIATIILCGDDSDNERQDHLADEPTAAAAPLQHNFAPYSSRKFQLDLFACPIRRGAPAMVLIPFTRDPVDFTTTNYYDKPFWIVFKHIRVTTLIRTIR